MARFMTDPSITYAGLQRPESTFELLMRMAQMREMGDERRYRGIREKEALLRLKELERATTEQEALRRATAAGVRTDVPITENVPLPLPGGSTREIPIPGAGGQGVGFDTQKSLQALASQAETAHLVPGAQAGFAAQEAERQKESLEIKAKAATLTKTQLENEKTKWDIGASLAQASIINPSSYPANKRLAEEMGIVEPGSLPEAASTPPELLPQLQSFVVRAMNVKDVLDQQLKVKKEGREQKEFEAKEEAGTLAGQLSDFEAAFQREQGRLPSATELEAHKARIAKAGRAPGEGQDLINVYADNLAAGRINVTDVPAKIRGQVLAAVQQAGNIVVPRPVRATLEQMDKAEGIIDTIEANYNALERSAGPEALVSGTLDKVLSKLQANPDAQMLRTQIGLLGNLARSISAERGVLTDRDVTRALELLPQLTDRADVARKKITQLRGFIQNARRAATSSMNQKFPQDGQGKSQQSTGAPQIGDRKTFPNGNVAEWDGNGWVLIQPPG